MSMVQAIRCKLGHHDWGPILGAVGEARHECEGCGKVKSIKVTPTRGYGGAHGNESGFHDGGMTSGGSH